MSDFTEVSHEGFGSSLMASIKGVLVGGICFLASFVLLFWNEGRAVQTQKSLEEGQGAVQSITKPDSVDKALEGKLVHLTGKADTKDTLTDPDFGVSAVAIKLQRTVQMYQWKENKKTRKKKKLGGGTERVTTYDYELVWSEREIDSAQFKQKYFTQKSKQQNPKMKYKSAARLAKQVNLGAYILSPALTEKISGGQPLAIDPAMAEKLPAGLKGQLKRKLTIRDGAYYYARRSESKPGEPQLGDMKISFQAVKPAGVSIIAQQSGDTFRAYQAKAGDALLDLRMGNLSADQMFAEAMDENATLTWVLRLAGFLLMAFGLFMMGGPLVALANVVPFLGDLLGVGIALFAGLVAAGLSLITIAIAWIFYRPVLGVCLLVAGIGLIFGLKKMGGTS